MRSETLYRAMNSIDDEIICRNGKVDKIGNINKNRRRQVYRIIATTAAAAILFAGTCLVKPWERFGQETMIDDEIVVENVGNDAGAAGYATETRNVFMITANAADALTVDDGTISSGDVVNMATFSALGGGNGYLSGRFQIGGENIDTVRITTDTCELYSSYNIYESDPEYEKIYETEITMGMAYGEGYYDWQYDDPYNYDEDSGEEAPMHFEHYTVEGSSYEGAYDPGMSFGMYVSDELREKLDQSLSDPEYSHACYDYVNGAQLTISVTFKDGTTEEHHYKVNVGKIFVPVDENGFLEWDNLYRFLTPEEESSCEVGYDYGYLLEKID